MRCLRSVVLGWALLSLIGVGPVRAQAATVCRDRFGLGGSLLPQAVYVPQLAEGAPYRITSPGSLTEEHASILVSILQRARCAAEAQRLPFGLLRLTVIARTDDLGAREIFKRAIRDKKVAEGQIDPLVDSIVNDVASRHRARIVVEKLRDELRLMLQTEPDRGAADPNNMVQAADPMDGEMIEMGPIWGEPSQPHGRSFLVVLSSQSIPLTPPQPALSAPSAATELDGCPGCTAHAEPTAQPLDPAPPKRPPPLLGTPQFDALLGIAVATQPYTRTFLYRELGWLSLGVRLPIWRIELGVRMNLLASAQPISLNGYRQDQLRLGVGAALQVGGQVVNAASVRLALGVEVGWIYLYRRIERIDSAPPGELLISNVHAPQAGGWLRLDVPLPRVPRLALSAEFSLDAIPFSSANEVPANLTAKALGGMTYALR